MVREEIAVCTARLIANPVAHKLRAADDRRAAGACQCRCERSDAAPATRRRSRGELRALVAGARVGRGDGRRDHRARAAPAGTTRCRYYTRAVRHRRCRRRRRCGCRTPSSTPPAERLDPDVRAGLRAGDRRTSPRVAQARLRAGPDGRASTATRSRCARCRSTRAAVYVPGRPRAVPEHGRDGSRRPPGPPGSQEIAVCSPPGRRRRGRSGVLGACRLAGASVVYRMGGAQAIAALAYGTETVAPVDVIVGPGQPVRAGGQAPGVRPGRDRRLRRAERPARDRRRRCRHRRRSRSTCSPRPSTARDSLVRRDLGLRRSCSTQLADRRLQDSPDTGAIARLSCRSAERG